MKRLVFIVALLAVCGCADPMIVDIERGTYCNSTNVEAYANKHGITYEQALNEMRRQSDEVLRQRTAEAQADRAAGNGTQAVQR
ncbi:MAG: hypothetical protein JXM70_16860 [Pirellulales bacterium]|nr:hypothetical protein [Pirellulales bacterium]